jgi:hypothetical protein
LWHGVISFRNLILWFYRYQNSEANLAGFIQGAIEAAPSQPILIDKFMEDAFEIDVDALADGERVVVGAALITVNDMDKSVGLKFARDMHRMGFSLYATPGTADMCMKVGLPVEVVEKAMDGSTQILDLTRGENPIGVEHAVGSARAHGWSRDPQSSNCDECAVAYNSFRGDGGGLCDSGVG